MGFDIASQVEKWRSQLLDTSKRNQLVSFKAGRAGGVRLVHPGPEQVWRRLVAAGAAMTFVWQCELVPELGAGQAADSGIRTPALFSPDEEPEEAPPQTALQRCLASPHLRENHLLTDLPDQQLARRLTRLDLNARTSLTEQGVPALYVAFGFLKWYESEDSGVEIRAPLLLLPVRLQRENVQAPWQLALEEEEVTGNHTLAQLLAQDFRLRLPSVPEDFDLDDPRCRLDYFAKVREAVRGYARWEVLDEVAISTVGFQKMAMWGDLVQNLDRIGEHPLCRAIAGDTSARLGAPAGLIAARDLDDRIRPHDTFHILDSDSSQHEAILAAKSGASLILDGPPGTGKSQTIANLIAESLAQGKTVLFVSEKAAALEVVKRRLDKHGLGDFCLECHSHKANKRAVVEELGRCLALQPEAAVDAGEDLDRLWEVRRQLNEYVRCLHEVRQPLGMSVYQVHGELARLERLAGISRCEVPNVLQVSGSHLRRLRELLAKLRDARRVVEEGERHPWWGCKATAHALTLQEDVRHHFSRLAERLGRAAGGAAHFAALGFGAARPTWSQWSASLAAAKRALECPLVPAAWFASDPRAVASSFVQLDQLTKQYRQLRQAVAPFSAAALQALEAPALAGLWSHPGGGCARLLAHTAGTVRALRDRLESAVDEVNELRRRLAGLVQAAGQVMGALGVRWDLPTLGHMSHFSAWARLVAQLGPVRRSWFDPAHRQELQTVLARCQEAQKEAQGLRVELVQRLSPAALGEAGAALAGRATRFRSALFRVLLFPRWLRLKADARNCYAGDLPATPQLLEDLEKLTGHHRRLQLSRQVAEQYAADLLPAEGGGTAWDRTADALAAVEQLEQLVKTPPTLIPALAGEVPLDRQVLSAAVAELVRQQTAFQEQFDRVRHCVDLSPVLDPAGQQVRQRPADLESWLQALEAALRREFIGLDTLCRLLAEDQDVPVNAVPARLVHFASLREVAGRIKLLAQQLGLAGGSGPAPEEADWSALRERAEALIRLLDEYPNGLPEPMRRGVTDAPFRARLEAAVRDNRGVRDDALRAGLQLLKDLFDTDRAVSGGMVIARAPLDELKDWVGRRATDAHLLHEWTQFRDAEGEIRDAGIAPILTEVLDKQLSVDEAPDAFTARFYRLWLDATYQQAPALRGFQAERHERLIQTFRGLDRKAVQLAPRRIRQRLLGRQDRPRLAGPGEAPDSSELGTLLREVNKKKRHLPLRQLFARIPTVLLRLKPCLMMSPLAVSTFLDTPEIRFDLVIFDEASQVRPHDAVCAIYRGRQLIVAGDQKQLPPTSFFERAGGDDEPGPEDQEDRLADFESILDVCCTLGLPRRRLRWHYRSKREPLIAFSNRFFYGNELVTFPSPYDTEGNPAVRFEFVEDGRWVSSSSGGYNKVEAHRAAELVLRHFDEHPDQSLGVIAFSRRQQEAILDELEALRRARTEMECFFDGEKDEPFFVKNLETVQGDERDVILLATGYGPEAGEPSIRKVAMRFGPLNRQGGERRLNVAVTRARLGLTLVSSMRAHDIDLGRTQAVGAHLLRAYLDFAERGMPALRAAVTVDSGEEFDSPFEREVAEELRRVGFTVQPQVGCSGYRIDLALVDPEHPGQYILGVECDGATYHGSATARDRDRLRQDVLEALGWRFCRIWSTDWFRDRKSQIERVRQAFLKARQEPAALPAVPAPPAQPMPTDGGAAKEPRPVVLPLTPEVPAYQDIDEVPAGVIDELVLTALRSYGKTPEEEVKQWVRERLGFKRTGARIRAGIEARVEQLRQGGKVSRTEDGCLRLAKVAGVTHG